MCNVRRHEHASTILCAMNWETIAVIEAYIALTYDAQLISVRITYKKYWEIPVPPQDALDLTLWYAHIHLVLKLPTPCGD